MGVHRAADERRRRDSGAFDDERLTAGALLQHAQAVGIEARANLVEVGLQRLVVVDAPYIAPQHLVQVGAGARPDADRVHLQPAPLELRQRGVEPRHLIAAADEVAVGEQQHQPVGTLVGHPVLVTRFEAVLIVERLVDVLERGGDVAIPGEGVAGQGVRRRDTPELLDEAVPVGREVRLADGRGAEDEQRRPVAGRQDLFRIQIQRLAHRQLEARRTDVGHPHGRRAVDHDGHVHVAPLEAAPAIHPVRPGRGHRYGDQHEDGEEPELDVAEPRVRGAVRAGRPQHEPQRENRRPEQQQGQRDRHRHQEFGTVEFHSVAKDRLHYAHGQYPPVAGSRLAACGRTPRRTETGEAPG